MRYKYVKPDYTMLKLILAFIVCLILAFGIKESLGWSATYHSAPDGNWITATGTEEDPFGTLGSATTSDFSSNFSTDDILIVHSTVAGEHGTLTLSSWDADGLLIMGDTSGERPVLTGVNLTSVSNLTIYNISSIDSTQGAYSGLFDIGYGCYNVTIDSCYAQYMSELWIAQPDSYVTEMSVAVRGVSITASDKITVTKCAIRGVGNGVVALTADSLTITFNNLNVYSEDGIKIALGTHVVIEDNHLIDLYQMSESSHGDAIQAFNEHEETFVTDSPPPGIAEGDTVISEGGAVGIVSSINGDTINVALNTTVRLFSANADSDKIHITHDYTFDTANPDTVHVTAVTYINIAKQSYWSVQRNIIIGTSYTRTDSYVHGDLQGIALTDGWGYDWNISNNIIKVAAQQAITAYSVNKLRIYNNTIIDDYTGDALVQRIYARFTSDEDAFSSDDIEVLNNIVENVASPVIVEGSPDSSYVANNFTANPDSYPAYFRNYSQDDFYPAVTRDDIIGAAKDTLNTPTVDVYGYPRDENPDMGAVEYGAAGDQTSWVHPTELPTQATINTYVGNGDSIKLLKDAVTLKSLSLPASNITVLPTGAGLRAMIDGRTLLDFGDFTDNINVGATTDTISATFQQFYYSSDADWATARDAATADGRNYYFAAGTNTNTVFRGSAMFIIPSEATNVTSATVQFEIESNVSAVDDTIYLVSAYNAPSTATSNFPLFFGRATGSAHTSVILSAKTTAGLTTGWEGWTVNAHGLDSLEAAAGDTMKYFGIAKQEYDNTGFPANDSYITSESQRLIISYGSGVSDTLPSWKYLGYDPYRVWINGTLGTRVAYDDLDASGEYAVGNDTLYVILEDKGAVEVVGNYAFDANDSTGIRIENVYAKNFNNLCTSGIIFVNCVAESIQKVEPDSAYRMTVAECESLFLTHMLNTLAAHNTYQDSTGTGLDNYLTTDSLDTNYVDTALDFLALNGDYYGAIAYEEAAPVETIVLPGLIYIREQKKKLLFLGP